MTSLLAQITAAASPEYGPYGFGLVALLILWRVVVAPELDRARVTAETYARAVQATAAACESALEASRVNKAATEQLLSALTSNKRGDA